LALRTVARESSYWPTTTTTDAKASGAAGYSTESGRHSGTTLTDAAVRRWPTPQAHDCHTPKTPEQIETMRAKGAGVRNLNESAVHWPTPCAADGERRSETLMRGEGNPTLLGAARNCASPAASSTTSATASLWPTPAARDHRSPNSTSYEDRGGTTKGEQLPNFLAHKWQDPTSLSSHQDQETQRLGESPPPASNRPQLNPNFVDWLLGLVPGWTDCALVETASWYRRQRLHLSYLIAEEATT